MNKKLRYPSLFIGYLLTWPLLLRSGTLGHAATTLQAAKDPALQSRINLAYAKLPLTFEANHGQTEKAVKFLAHGNGYSLFLTPTETVLSLHSNQVKSKLPIQSAQASLLRMKLLGANAAPRVLGANRLPGESHYFIGNKPDQWQTSVPQYGKVRYEQVYPGIDLVYYGNQKQLEYDFIVAPKANPTAIKLGFQGTREVTLNTRGDLVLATPLGKIVQYAPVMYQEINGERKHVSGRYVISTSKSPPQRQYGRYVIGFEVRQYDHSLPLIIDPVLAYSTYLGGNQEDWGQAIAVDSSGNAYVTGYTNSTDFPLRNSLLPVAYRRFDVFVSKLSADGSTLLYSTVIGGIKGHPQLGGNDEGYGIAVDAAGNAYVAGMTESTDFPTKNALQASSRTIAANAFVLKLTATGSLMYSTYLGGSQGDAAKGIAVDGDGNAYVTGYTFSDDFPMQHPLQAHRSNSNNTFSDAFITKINTAGTALIYSTYLGGSASDQGNGIAVDNAGNAYVVGSSESTDFPTTPNVFQPTYRGGSNVFVTKVNPTGTALAYSTYLGGNGRDYGGGIAVDNTGNAYVAGYTESSDFPTQNALQPTKRGGFDAFVAKLNAMGTSLVYSTYLGGSGDERGPAGAEQTIGIAVDSIGNAYVTGTTTSTDFPMQHPVQPTYGGGRTDAFVAKLNSSGSALVYASYLGSLDYDFGTGIAVDSTGNVYVTGATASTHFPFIAQHAFQSAHKGGFDAFVTKLQVDDTPPAATIDKPTNRAKLGDLSVLSGTATDGAGSGISRVLLFIRRVSDGKYWSGRTWQSTGTDLSPKLSPGLGSASGVTTWSLTSNLPTGTDLTEGVYRITAVAVDRAFNRTNTNISITIEPLAISTVVAHTSSQNLLLAWDGSLNYKTATDASHYVIEVNSQTVAVQTADYNSSDHSVTLRLPPGTLQSGDRVIVRWNNLLGAKSQAIDGQAGPLIVQQP